VTVDAGPGRRLLALLLAATIGSAPEQGAPAKSYRPGIDVVSYDFTIALPLRGAMDTIAVDEVVVVRRTRRDTLVLDLLAPMVVSDVTVSGRPVSFRRDSVAVGIPLPRGNNDSVVVSLRYHGKPLDGLVMRADSSGRWTAFGDNYPDRARHWLATVDHPSDKAIVRWTIRHPATTRAIANGELLEESPDPAGGMVTRWRSTRPMYTAVMVIGVGPFAVYELGETACGMAERPGCVRQSVWVAPEVRPTMPGAFSQAAAIVDWYAHIVAPFPYEKLAHVESATRWGGMENASAIFYSDQSFRRGGVGEGTIAHEIAHQWFGDAVTEREWPDVWLSESFATYFAALWTEHSRGDSAFRGDLVRMRQAVLDAPVTVREPVVRDSVPDLATLLNSNVYQKGGFVLHMLRRMIGDSAFFRGIRSYYVANRHGTASTADLRRAFESTSGTQLGWFFDQWLRRPGYADLSLSWRWDQARRVVLLTVGQNERFAPYQLTLTMDATDARGRTQRVSVNVPATRAGTIPVPLTMNAAPARIEFDRDVGVLGRVPNAQSGTTPP
jgi:aminopeptidase N